MNLFSPFSQQSVQEIINTLTKFKVNTGLKLNYVKSCVHRIGSAKNLIARLYTSKQLHWTDDPVKFLVYISNDSKQMLAVNYEGIVVKIKGILKTWKIRNLSVLGNVIMINSLIGSLFIYKMNVNCQQFQTKL